MTTECRTTQLEFEEINGRRAVASFTGGYVTSDGGMLLLHELEARTGLMHRFAACFHDHRNPARVQHTVEELVKQRVYALACGYEDLNDHATLRDDPLLAAVVGKSMRGKRRARKRKLRCSRTAENSRLASPSTLNRLELTPSDADASSRYCKIVYDEQAISNFFVEAFLLGHRRAPRRIVLDLDATDDPLHGKQEGRFFHGYYGHYCYLPLYIFCGEDLLCAKLREANIDASAGALDEVARIVAGIRARWPNVAITLRADSGFARDELMSWAEDNGVDYVFGLARNERLQALIADQLAEVEREAEASGAAARRFADLCYRTRDSWSRERRVVAKAEHLPNKSNPRFVVTSCPPDMYDARTLYEDVYCARGDMENRIKEQQLGLFADRTSAHTMRANQLRLWLSSVAYVLLCQLRRHGLAGTEVARAQVGTIRSKLLKLGGVVTVSARRILVTLSRAAPVQHLLPRILANLRERIPIRV